MTPTGALAHRSRAARALLAAAVGLFVALFVACGGGDDGGGGGEPPMEPTSATVEGQVVRTNDDAGLAGVQVSLTDDGGAAQATTTDADGSYAFEEVETGEHTVSVERRDLPELGSLVSPQDTAVAVEGSDPVAGVDFRFRQAEATQTIDVSTGAAVQGETVTVTVSLGLNPDVPGPFSSVAGEITWDPAIATYVPASVQAADAGWDLGAVNPNTAGSLRFSAVSAQGAEAGTDDVLGVLTFEVEVTGSGSTEITPDFSELQRLDPETGASTGLLGEIVASEATAILDAQ